MDGDEYSVNYSTCPSPRLSPVTRRCPALSSTTHYCQNFLPNIGLSLFLCLIEKWKETAEREHGTYFIAVFIIIDFIWKIIFQRIVKKHFLACTQWLSDPNLGISLRSGRFIPMSWWSLAHLRCQPGHKGDCGHFHGNIIISGQGAVRHCTLFKTIT